MANHKQIGAHAIPNGADLGGVNGLQLVVEPSSIIVTVRKPAGGLNLFASVIGASISGDGFAFELSAATDSDKYVLDYQIIT